MTLHNRIPINILSNEEESNSENRNENFSTTKQTFITEDRESLEYPKSQFVIQRDNSQTIIIEPEFTNNNNINNIKNEKNDNNEKISNKILNFGNYDIQYNENDNEEKNENKNEDIENNGIINKKAKIFTLIFNRASTSSLKF